VEGGARALSALHTQAEPSEVIELCIIQSSVLCAKEPCLDIICTIILQKCVSWKIALFTNRF
jgi:hypothetical protein